MSQGAVKIPKKLKKKRKKNKSKRLKRRKEKLSQMTRNYGINLEILCGEIRTLLILLGKTL